MKNDMIKLAYGSGGREMGELISLIRKNIPYKGDWECTDEDSAVLNYTKQHGDCENTPPSASSGQALTPHCLRRQVKRGTVKCELTRKNLPLPPSSKEGETHFPKLVFTTDAFVVSPIFFKGGNIGDLAFNGTVNDLLMQGAKPLGISLALVIEEGFLLADLEKILKSIGNVSKEIKVPIATGDTKVVSRGAIDKIMITTAGVGMAEKIISDRGLRLGNKIIASGTLGDHGAALLAHRFGYKTKLASDTKSLLREMSIVGKYLTSAKDPTRGGMAAVLNEMAEKSKVKIILDEDKIPISKETVSICKLLGIDKYSLASEGRFIAGAEEKDVNNVIKILKKFNKDSCVIGKVEKGSGVFIKNFMGDKKLELPTGVLVPRIC